MTGLLHGDGAVSRACRRGYHRHCPGGCECSCHDGLGPVGVLQCSDPPEESCSDAGCPAHGDPS